MKKISDIISITAAAFIFGVLCLSLTPLHGTTVNFQDNFEGYQLNEPLPLAAPWISIQPSLSPVVVSTTADQHAYAPGGSQVLRVTRTASGAMIGSTGNPNTELFLRDVASIDFSFQFRNDGAGSSAGSYVYLDTGSANGHLGGIYFRDGTSSSFLSNNGALTTTALTAAPEGSNVLALNTWYQANFSISVDHVAQNIGYTVEIVQLSTGSVVATGSVEAFTNPVNLDARVRLAISPQTNNADFQLNNISVTSTLIPEPSTQALLSGLVVACFLIWRRFRNRN